VGRSLVGRSPSRVPRFHVGIYSRDVSRSCTRSHGPVLRILLYFSIYLYLLIYTTRRAPGTSQRAVSTRSRLKMGSAGNDAAADTYDSDADAAAYGGDEF